MELRQRGTRCLSPGPIRAKSKRIKHENATIDETMGCKMYHASVAQGERTSIPKHNRRFSRKCCRSASTSLHNCHACKTIRNYVYPRTTSLMILFRQVIGWNKQTLHGGTTRFVDNALENPWLERMHEQMDARRNLKTIQRNEHIQSNHHSA